MNLMQRRVVQTAPLKVAIPWNLTHYIPLNGFHPLYRALFDHCPEYIELHALDNTKLFHHFSHDITSIKMMNKEIRREKQRSKTNKMEPQEKSYFEYIPLENRVVGKTMDGDIEFHHTGVFPSLKRPFIFHCETFAQIFFPCTQDQITNTDNSIRKLYGEIFSHPFCLGIFSHIPETLENIRTYFSDERINAKLFHTRIGLSKNSFLYQKNIEKPSLSHPYFLFINSENQNPNNFFLSGGHVVLKFWQLFLHEGFQGTLTMRCQKPSDQELSAHNIDIDFITHENDRSILWIEDNVTHSEQVALVAHAHFFLLPSLSLHSVSIMQAMSLGTIPVVTDTIGTSVYLNETQGIILKGMRDNFERKEPLSDITLEPDQLTSEMEDNILEQMVQQIPELLNNYSIYQKLQKNMLNHAQKEFSGEVFSFNFWEKVYSLYQNYHASNPRLTFKPSSLTGALASCTLKPSDFSRLFESRAQPMRTLYTGKSVVYTCSGSYIAVLNDPKIDLHHWTFWASNIKNSCYPHIQMVKELSDLDKSPIKLIHHAQSNTYSKSLYLVKEGICKYNILRFQAKYFAVLQAEGDVSPDKILNSEYVSLMRNNWIHILFLRILLKRIYFYFLWLGKKLFHKIPFMKKLYKNIQKILKFKYHYFNYILFVFGYKKIDIQLFSEEVYQYNIIRIFHKYYTILSFDNEQFSILSSYSFRKLQNKIRTVEENYLTLKKKCHTILSDQNIHELYKHILPYK